jgi:flagellar motility protein MotE (MotC chaperone)
VRIIPLTIFFAVVFFSVKFIDIMSGTELLSVSNAQAEQAPEEKPAEEPAKPAEAAQAEKPAGEQAQTKKDSGETKEGKDEGNPILKNPAVSLAPGETVSNRLTHSETELLQNLSKRREELERWERNIQVKEVTLQATEKRINEKIGKIEAMQQQVSVLLEQYNSQEDAKIRSLVKIYESMKPVDAARIFDEVEMPILLLVIDKMSEKKAAPILAQMDSKKAKQITVVLAAQRRVDSARINRVTSPARTQ